MSNTVSVKGESSEEKMDELDDDEEKVMCDETMMKTGNDTEITVNPGNIKVSCIQSDQISILCTCKAISRPPRTP